MKEVYYENGYRTRIETETRLLEQIDYLGAETVMPLLDDSMRKDIEDWLEKALKTFDKWSKCYVFEPHEGIGGMIA